MKRSDLVKKLGSQARVAKELQLARSTVCEWPEQLSDFVLGRVARLRPDLLKEWWAEQEQGLTQPTEPEPVVQGGEGDR